MPFQGQQVNLSGEASGALVRGRFVTIDSNGQWAYPAAGATAVGVTLEGSSAQGDVINVAALNGAQLEVEANAALATLGTLIATAVDGQAAAATTGQVVLGHLGSTAGAADEIVDVVTVSGSAAP